MVVAAITAHHQTRSFSGLLDEQYALIEEYANAQTFLYNAITTTTSRTTSRRTKGQGPSLVGDDSTIKALERLDEAKTNVRSNFMNIRDYDDTDIKERHWHSGHINISRRVIETISNNPCSWHANGLPTAVGNNNGGGGIANEGLKTNTVAIAALKASIARIREMEETL